MVKILCTFSFLKLRGGLAEPEKGQTAPHYQHFQVSCTEIWPTFTKEQNKLSISPRILNETKFSASILQESCHSSLIFPRWEAPGDGRGQFPPCRYFLTNIIHFAVGTWLPFSLTQTDFSSAQSWWFARFIPARHRLGALYKFSSVGPSVSAGGHEVS